MQGWTEDVEWWKTEDGKKKLNQDPREVKESCERYPMEPSEAVKSGLTVNEMLPKSI